ncbi:TauD/TfdA family dioxygenase [Pseudomonas chengduensis]|nr:TauD/TfdA family dioxygenase [Pseudomonas chengduensis]MDH1869264.1 TauD/TfdA family dioxygenase [Pseudomonas chengduensis]
MQLEDIFAEAVRTTVVSWMGERSPEQCVEALCDPVKLAEELLPRVREHLEARSVNLPQLKSLAWSEPCIHLQGVFPVEGASSSMPETPRAFLPVPDCQATIAARVSSVACIAAIESSLVSYASENDGHLFVNLVALDGEGDMVDKSKAEMRGHTDGVFFPIRGERDETYPKFAPSPDFVCLSGLRNPDATDTTVMPLNEVLMGLSEQEIEELCKPQFTLVPQKTFRAGVKQVMNWPHARPPRIDNRRVLFKREEGFWIRFSHSSVVDPIQDEGTGGAAIHAKSAASSAREAFMARCRERVRSVILKPGDILLVNNRVGLHGRSEVGGEVGGESRWLLRTYGLETGDLAEEQRFPGSNFKLYP